MCGRYHFSAELLDEIRDVTEQKDWKLELGVLDRDIHPGDTAPVIVAALEEASHVPAPAKNAGAASYAGRGGSLRVCRQKWGYPGPGGKGLVFNARSESVFEKRMFRDSVSTRRAVVPVSWFYEWNKNKEKFTFTKEGSRILFLAGFYGRYEAGPMRPWPLSTAVCPWFLRGNRSGIGFWTAQRQRNFWARNRPSWKGIVSMSSRPCSEMYMI